MPQGYRHCEKCGHDTKGPKSEVCQGCGYTFPRKSAKPPATKRSGKQVKVAKPVNAPCPYTTHIDMPMYTFDESKRLNIGGRHRRPKSDLAVFDFVGELTPVDAGFASNFTAYAM